MPENISSDGSSLFDDDYQMFSPSSDSEFHEVLSENINLFEDINLPTVNDNAESKFKINLHRWALLFHITLTALTALLLLLKPIVPFSLPADARTLMGP